MDTNKPKQTAVSTAIPEFISKKVTNSVKIIDVRPKTVKTIASNGIGTV